MMKNLDIDNYKLSAIPNRENLKNLPPLIDKYDDEDEWAWVEKALDVVMDSVQQCSVMSQLSTLASTITAGVDWLYARL